MLDTFRKHSNSTLVYLIFGALIFVFIVSFGQGSAGFKADTITGSAEYAARVNDETISVMEFQKQYRNQLAMIEQRTGQPLSEELADQLGFKKQALESLVNSKLLVQAAKKRGLAVSDEELGKEIVKVPAFQKDGAFDKEAYTRFLQYQGTTPSEFEAREREALLTQKMVALISASANVSDDEVRAEFNKEHDKADLTFVRFLPSQFMDQVKVNPTPAELDAYVQAHAQEIQAFYTRNSYRYHKPQRFQARDILVKAAKDASADEDAKAKAKADQAAAALKSGKSFADVAKEFSEDSATKDKGGEMGAFVAAAVDKPLQDALAKLQPGQTSDVVRTQFGYQIVQLEKIVPPEDHALDEVKKDIAQELMRTDAARKMAQEKADEALKAAQAGKKLAELYPASKDSGTFDLAAANKIESQQTGPFALQGPAVPKIGQAPEIAQAAFSLTMEKPLGPKVYESGNAFYVIELASREKPNEADFGKQKEDLRQVLLQKKQNDILGAFLKELREDGKVEENQALTMPSTQAS